MVAGPKKERPKKNFFSLLLRLHSITFGKIWPGRREWDKGPRAEGEKGKEEGGTNKMGNGNGDKVFPLPSCPLRPHLGRKTERFRL